MTSAQKKHSQEIPESKVKDYLQEHPEFFHHNLDLLEQMSIPHPSGNAISLISKQLEIFRNRHHELETQLTSLIDIARENDTVANRMHELTLSMLDAASIEDIQANLEHVLFECFLTDFVALRIIRKMNNSPIDNLFIDPEDDSLNEFDQVLINNQPKCGRPTLKQAKILFGDAATEIKSCAMIPLLFTELEGILAIGSRQEDRFHQDMGHLFLTQMSEIVGTRLISLLQHDQS